MKSFLIILLIFHNAFYAICESKVYESEEYLKRQNRLLSTLKGTKNIRSVILLCCSLYIIYYLVKLMNKRQMAAKKSKHYLNDSLSSDYSLYNEIFPNKIE